LLTLWQYSIPGIEFLVKSPYEIPCRNSAGCIELTWTGGIELKRFIPLAIVTFSVILVFVYSYNLRRPFATDKSLAPASITLAGSTSVQPFAELLADEYMNEGRSVIINVQGGGSSAGGRAVLSGVAEIGMLSRELQGDEKALIPTVIAYDAIAIIVHPSNPWDNLDVPEIRSIFSAETPNWPDIGGKPHKIHVVAREEGSGTRGAFDEIIMGDTEVTPGAIIQDSNGAVREIVAGDPFAIGYISLGLVDKRVKAIAISGTPPSINAVAERTYKLTRPMILAVQENPKKEVIDFLDFCLSEKAQEMLAQEGLVPVAPKTSKESPGPREDN
jgi:phosphate transport system substrate-binding protein